MRGHAMFSGCGRSLDAETLEYAWLMELTVGSFTGRLTTPQVAYLHIMWNIKSTYYINTRLAQVIMSYIVFFIILTTASANCTRN